MAVITKNADRAGIEQKMLTIFDGKADPSGCQHPQHMPMREHRNISIGCPRAGNYPINLRRNAALAGSYDAVLSDPHQKHQ